MPYRDPKIRSASAKAWYARMTPEKRAAYYKLSPEQRAAKRELYKNLTPEEKERRRKRESELRQFPERRIRYLANKARSRSRVTGKPFEEGLIDYLLLDGVPTRCPCCRTKFDFILGKGLRRYARTPTLDRIENSEGYTKKNTRILCFRCNVLKSDGDHKEFREIVKYIERETRGKLK